MREFIIARYLRSDGKKPYFIEGCLRNSFKTLKALKEYYGIKKVVKDMSSWAINHNGTRVIWNTYKVVEFNSIDSEMRAIDLIGEKR